MSDRPFKGCLAGSCWALFCSMADLRASCWQTKSSSCINRWRSSCKEGRRHSRLIRAGIFMYAGRLLQRAERVQIRRSRARLINRKLDRAIAEALQRLTQCHDAALARAAHFVEVDFQRNQLFAAAGLVQYLAMRIADQRSAIAASTQTIDVEQVALVRG